MVAVNFKVRLSWLNWNAQRGEKHMATESNCKLGNLLNRLDAAVDGNCPKQITNGVKLALEDLIQSGECVLEARFVEPCPGKYARRLIHRHPECKYTLMAMVWDKDQGTPIHDHAGMWCVECVYRGRIKVVSYSLIGSDNDVPCKFEKETEIHAGPGEAGALIPPYDYHTIENDTETPTITLHVYGGEMTSCHVFVPIDGGFERQERALCYTE